MAKTMYLAAEGKTEAQWDKNSFKRCKFIVETTLCLLNCTAKTSVCGGPINPQVKEKLNLPGEFKNFVLGFEFKVAHACMWLGSLVNVLTYATNGKEVLKKFINALRLADMEEEY